MQTVSQSLSTKTQLLEDILLRVCKSPQMAAEASDTRSEQFRSLVDIYSDKNIVAPGLPFVEMAYFVDMQEAFDVVSYHENLSNEQLRLDEDNLARYQAFRESGADVVYRERTISVHYLYCLRPLGGPVRHGDLRRQPVRGHVDHGQALRLSGCVLVPV